MNWKLCLLTLQFGFLAQILCSGFVAAGPYDFDDDYAVVEEIPDPAPPPPYEIPIYSYPYTANVRPQQRHYGNWVQPARYVNNNRGLIGGLLDILGLGGGGTIVGHRKRWDNIHKKWEYSNEKDDSSENNYGGYGGYGGYGRYGGGYNPVYGMYGYPSFGGFNYPGRPFRRVRFAK